MIRDETKPLSAAPQSSDRDSGNDRAGLAALGGLVGAVAASACCVLPLALFSLGAGGIWIGRLAALSPYQPVFVVLAVSAIAYGFFLVYGRPRESCGDQAPCSRPIPRRLVKGALWSSTALVLVSLVYPYAIPFVL